MIAIVDYGIGDLYSLSKALEALEHRYLVTTYPLEIRKATGIILTGEGAFANGMKGLAEAGVDRLLKEEAFAGKPILGIGLGMQLLFTSSDEGGYHQGLNLLPGHIRKLETDDMIPHIGWNWLQFKHPHCLYKGLEEGEVYFNHSYYVDVTNKDDVIGTTNYYQPIPAIVARGNMVGMQFSPEKSGVLGMQLLDRFITQISCKNESVGK